ncbi:MAG: TonB-dependent receptor [Pseudomonadota bacterium]
MRIPGAKERHTYVWLTVMAALWLAAPAFTRAQTDGEGAQTLAIDVQAQDLGSALIELSGYFDTNIFGDRALLQGKRGNAVNGVLTVEGALSKVLAGTGLTANRSAAGGYVIVEAPTTESNADTQPKVAPPKKIDQIVVRGTKRNLSLQKTQASVAVITDRDIEAQALFTVEDILLRTANVSTGGDGTLNTLSIRGISIGGVGGAGRGQTSNVYVDGSPNSESGNIGAANLWDVEQVEVLRGPQSTTQGRNALAGALVTTSADPVYEWGADVRAVVGNENNEQYSATVNIPLIDDTLAFRASVDQRDIDFEVLNVATGNNTRFQEAFTGRAKVLWEPTADLRFELGYSRTETDVGERNRIDAPGPVGSPEFAAFDRFGRQTFAVDRERFDTVEADRTYLETQWTLDENWSLFALVTREDTLQDNFFGNGGGLGNTVIDTAELRTQFDFGRFEGWIGAYWFDLETAGSSFFRGPFPLPSIPADVTLVGTSSNSTTTQNRALFADISYELNERWTLSAGLRYDEEEFRNTAGATTFEITPADCVINPIFPTFGGQPCQAFIDAATGSEEPILPSGDFDAWLPRASVIYRFDDQRSLSFNYARGYRAGGSFIRNVPPAPQLLEFDPEFLDNYELAWRSQWFDQRLTVNANIFYSDWKDQQISIPGPTGFALDALTINAGRSELYGLEIEAQVALTDTVTAFGSLGLVRTRFEDFPFAIDENGAPSNPDDPTFADLSGNEFNNAPETTVAVGLTWDGGSGWFASGNASYASDRFADVTNLPENRGGEYILVNARAGYRWDQWSVAAFADNLFDERVALDSFFGFVSTATGEVEVAGGPSFTVNDPRIYGLEVRYSF